jgi:hypothetical protein
MSDSASGAACELRAQKGLATKKIRPGGTNVNKSLVAWIYSLKARPYVAVPIHEFPIVLPSLMDPITCCSRQSITEPGWNKQCCDS